MTVVKQIKIIVGEPSWYFQFLQVIKQHSEKIALL